MACTPDLHSPAGWAEQATCIRGHSHRVELPERVDVVICDRVGYFGFDDDIVQTLQDARRRPDSRPDSSPTRRSGIGNRLLGRGLAGVLAEFHWLRQHTVNAKHAVELPREAVLGTPAELGVINLYADHPDFFSWTAELPIERDGVMHGLAGWFECELADGVWMTNSPLAERAIRRPQAFLPIDAAVPVRAGDAVKARVMARSTDHLIAWVVESGVVVPGLPHHATQRGHRRHPTQVEALERALSAVGRRLTVESREMA